MIQFKDKSQAPEVRRGSVHLRRPVHLPSAAGRRHPAVRHRRGAGRRRSAPARRDHPRHRDPVQQPLRRDVRGARGGHAAGRGAGDGPPGPDVEDVEDVRHATAACVSMTDDPAAIMRKFKRAVTDSDNEVRYDPVAKPGVSNLLEILGAATRTKPADLAAGYTQYGRLKTDTGEAVVALLEPIQRRYRELLDDQAELSRLLRVRVGQGPRRRLEDARARLLGDRAASGLSRRRPTDRLVGRFRDPADRRIIALAVPALGALAVEPLYVLVDTAIVGRLGTPQLAGLAVAATVLSFVVRRRPTSSPTARPSGSPAGWAPAIAPGAADVGVQAMWLSVLVGVPAAAAPRVGAPTDLPAARRVGRRAQHATDYLQISAVGIPFVLVTLAAQGVLRGVVGLLPAADHPARLEPRQHRARDRVRVRARPRRPRIGVVDGDRPGRWLPVAFACRRSAPTCVPAVTRRPARAGMAPLANAGRHLAAPCRRDVGRVRRVDGDRRPHRRADVGCAPDRDELVLVPRAVARRPRRAGPDARRRGARPRRAVATARHLASRAVRLSLVAATRPRASSWRCRRRGCRTCSPSDESVASRATSALWFAGRDDVPGRDRVRPRRGADRCRRLPLPRPGGGRLPGRRGTARCARARSTPTSASPASGPRLTVWMMLRAVVNHHRTARLLAPAVHDPSAPDAATGLWQTVRS